jgi:hypothetical protein
MNATAKQTVRFLALFHGSDHSHYVRNDSKTHPVPEYRAISSKDAKRHLNGRKPSLLIVPTNAEGISYCGCLDIDAHGPDEPPVNHARLAWRVTQLDLPLVVCKSTHGRGAWLYCFIREAEGISSGILRSQLKRYADALGVIAEIYPKQDALIDGQAGSCVGLPYFGTVERQAPVCRVKEQLTLPFLDSQRPAFGPRGEKLTLDEFLDFAESQRTYGALFDATAVAKRDPEDFEPVSIWRARELFDEHLAAAKIATRGERNATAHKCAWFAARSHLAGVFQFFGETEEEIRQTIVDSIKPLYGPRERDLEKMIRDSWNYGLRAGRLELQLHPNEIAAIRKIQDERFDLAWGGNVDSFASAIDAKKFLEERLSSVGVVEVDRVLRASGIGAALLGELR